MKKEIKNKQEKGITLIALVVTIVVLLILAGVSISLVLNNNGVISRAKEAKNQYAEEQTNVEKQLNELANGIDEMEKEIKKVDGVPIPERFVYVGGTKASGLVISDAAADNEKYKGQTTAVNNIYDMGGNVWEWTTESSSGTDGRPFTLRGGNYFSYFAGYPAGYRFTHYDTAHVYLGFRLTLFL